MVSQAAFTVLVALLGMQRLAELSHSSRNEERLRARGAIEHAPWQVTMLALLHGTWLLAMLAEVWLLDRSFQPSIAIPALLLFVLGQLLRLTAIRTLGDRWTVGVWTLPGVSRVRAGLYSRLPHPNYLGVVLEIAALPLVHGAVLTAVGFSLLNGIALFRRLEVESRALRESES